MHPSKKEHFMRRPTFVFLLIALASAGCSSILSRTMPPEKIPMDRRNYLDYASQSWKEQLLSNLVKIRYGDTLTCLEMTAVNTAYEMDTTGTLGYTQNMTPSAGTAAFFNTLVVGGSLGYQDKPTITYVPLKGDALMKTMIQPLPLSQVLKSLQTGWKPGYIFSCCIKSINDLRNNLQNPSDDEFFTFAQLFGDLMADGVIRITIPETVEPKVTKVPKEYTITLKDERKKPKCEPENGPALRAATPPQPVKKAGEDTDKIKEKEDTSIGLLVLDIDRAKRDKNLMKELNKLKERLWPNFSSEEKHLYELYNSKCLCCHAAKDRNIGIGSISSYLRINDSTDPKFWMGDLEQRITQAVKKGHKNANLHITDAELKALIALITHDFGRYEVYKIYDGNQELPLDPYCDKIAMQTRSIYQVLLYLSQFIKVPPEQLEKHGDGQIEQNEASESFFDKQHKEIEPLNGVIKGEYRTPENRISFEIKYQKEYPKGNFVAVQQHGYWFYIENTNNDAKSIFSSTAGILSMSETAPPAAGAPTLTLPVQ
jgi:hypothetical protein